MIKDVAPLVAKAKVGQEKEESSKFGNICSRKKKEKKEKKQITYKTKENNVRETHIASCH